MGEVFRQNLAAIALLILRFFLLFFPQFIMSFKSAQLLGNAIVVDIIDCHDYSIYIVCSIFHFLFHFLLSLTAGITRLSLFESDFSYHILSCSQSFEGVLYL